MEPLLQGLADRADVGAAAGDAELLDPGAADGAG